MAAQIDSLAAYEQNRRELANPAAQRPKFDAALARLQSARRAPAAARKRLVDLESALAQARADADRLQDQAAELEAQRRELLRTAVAGGADSDAQEQAAKLKARRETLLDAHALALDPVRTAEAAVAEQLAVISAADAEVKDANLAARAALSRLAYAQMMEAVEAAFARYASVWRYGDPLPPSFDDTIARYRNSGAKGPWIGDQYGIDP